MSRILILLPFLIWLAWKPGDSSIPSIGLRWGFALFLGFYALLVLAMGLWSRRLARHVAAANFHRSLRRFNNMIFAARMIIPAWFLVGVFGLGWGDLVHRLLLLTGRNDLIGTLPGVVLATLPPFLAWMGLWWSQYPADRALREQNLLSQLEADLPLHSPPGFWAYFSTNLRLQLLFMVVPVLLIVLLHDLAVLALHFTPWRGQGDFAYVPAAALVFFFAPEILRRVLNTEPLPNSPLRRRLDTLCRRTGVRYRDILLWKTENNMGNAAVMGFVPRLRYILLSDLLLESMTDEQIEAVFAHELGHVVHRHMAWYVVFVVVLSLINMALGHWLEQALRHVSPRKGVISDSFDAINALLVGFLYVAKFLVLFGFVSRRFERQADVFAARTMEMSKAPVMPRAETLLGAHALVGAGAGNPGGLIPGVATPRAMNNPEETVPGSYVGPYGATIFGSALHRVAIVNNIPIRARSWCHGSIAKRMQYLRELAVDPALTGHFDRVMLWLYGSMLFALFAMAAFCMATGIFV